MDRTLDTVFNHQVSNIYTGEAGKIQMQMKDQKIEIAINNNLIYDITNIISIRKKAVYLDGLFVANDSLDRIFNINLKYVRDGGLYQMNTDSRSIVEEIVIGKKLDHI